MILTSFCSLLALTFFVESGPLFEALEIFRVILSNDAINIRSTSGVADMVIWPDSIYTYLHGDGRFYDDSGSFYKHTDIGYFRVLYFSGVVGVVLFILMNTFILLFPLFKYRKPKQLGKTRHSLLLLVIVMNIKGLFLSLVFFPVIYLKAKSLLR